MTPEQPKPVGPRWRYFDNAGIEREGIVRRFWDHGGTDVTYEFLADDGTVSILSGSRLKQAKRI
jgi:hypothetical protein